MDKKQAVAGIGLFSGLGDKDLAALAAVAETRRYARGEDIFFAGEPASGFFSVVTGKVRIYQMSLAGKEHILHVFGPGEVFAEVAVFSDRVYPASAQAMEDGEYLFFPRERFRRLLADEPDLAMDMLGLLAVRLRQMVNKLEDLSLHEVPARLAAHLLLLEAQSKTRRLTLDLPKGQLAAYLGTIPETLSRVLRRFADDGLIALSGSAVELLDMPRLERQAGGRAVTGKG
ncbi:transcriptional regulator, Crp/Fnr family [Solidesulfovibrio fructosivorans JJ]]|uniref:Transcriptional regulator, Crp/Fnr family n=1 Tax=Solidesulfovibrio fructosivorans JJ] TaxID=596151 RepID=E1K2G3_SOLFR|nr:Crp/Fnr family transcriptional regulator [Solidesulfovibrio fructosivorans]EFL49196.1 transcriptional regulator, Crp/Fnr family [Solidesulfovibrio fructosivorans JJ]]